MKVISLLKVLRELNILKRKRIVKDYAIGGGIAKNYYLEPQFTYDLDIFILIDTMDDFHNIYKHFRKEKCKIENVFIFIKDVYQRDRQVLDGLNEEFTIWQTRAIK